MNTTMYTRPVSRPYQAVRPVDPRSLPPVRAEIEKFLGVHTVTAVIEEDFDTLRAMGNPEGMIAFIATLSKGDRVIAQGRGGSVLSASNKYVQRVVACAFNSALADAAIRAKLFDTFRDKTGDTLDEAYVSEPATDKQKEYLKQLVLMNVADDSEQDRLIGQIADMDKTEASHAIESFKK